MCTINSLPSASGTYVLILELKVKQRLIVGKLGQFEFPEGSYSYVGSAQGSGGLSGRLRRHLKFNHDKKPHWHIDHLNRCAEIAQIWWLEGSPSQECVWAQKLSDLGLQCHPNFGSSDCRCISHLFWFPKHTESPWLEMMKALNGNLKSIKIHPESRQLLQRS
jgi:sugar fermentation stimulation protein A